MLLCIQVPVDGDDWFSTGMLEVSVGMGSSCLHLAPLPFKTIIVFVPKAITHTHTPSLDRRSYQIPGNMDTDTILNTEEGKLLPRLEKKSRQSLAKLGLKRVEGINRVVLRRPGGVGAAQINHRRQQQVVLSLVYMPANYLYSPFCLSSAGPFHRWQT